MARDFGPFPTKPMYEVVNRRMQRALAEAASSTGFAKAGQGAVTAGTGAQLVIAAYPDGALVDGLWVENSASETVTLTTNSASTNPRIDRLVMRLDMGAETIAPFQIVGTPAASPQVPPLVQTSTVFDMPLCRYTMPGSASAQNPGSIVDERVSVSSDWVTYTPVLTSTGTAPVMVAGSRVGRYRRLPGSMIQSEMTLKWTGLGTGEGLGSGDYLISLPVSASGFYPVGAALGAASYIDVGTASYAGSALLFDAARVQLIVGTAKVSASLPVVPANGDTYSLSLTYEAS